ncbi:hypothetical protein F4677DRAFT_447803 [Hypoxylon crocopeplum]|nr:hypothetical protein F4677DRAFT_447803 [Hypoxylon crocopeplum]
MQVIIVGAGLSGLSTAIALRKFISASQSLEIEIYGNINSGTGQATEQATPQASTSRLGAGLGLQANGIHVLNDLDPTLKQKIYAAGFPCKHYTWKTAGDWLLGRDYSDDTLLEGSVIYKKVARVITQQGQKPVVQFEDESLDETADLVVGADEIRSTIRRDLFGEDEKYQPKYAGICAGGGVLDVPLPKHLVDNPTMLFFMESTGVFGYTGLTQSDKNKLLYCSRGRHGDWTDPLIGQCLAKANLDNIYPIFVIPDLPYWGRDGCVLVGDAAHALPPKSGQGVSQAFEDGEALPLLLAGYLEKGYS